MKMRSKVRVGGKHDMAFISMLYIVWAIVSTFCPNERKKCAPNNKVKANGHRLEPTTSTT